MVLSRKEMALIPLFKDEALMLALVGLDQANRGATRSLYPNTRGKGLIRSQMDIIRDLVLVQSTEGSTWSSEKHAGCYYLLLEFLRLNPVRSTFGWVG